MKPIDKLSRSRQFSLRRRRPSSLGVAGVMATVALAGVVILTQTRAASISGEPMPLGDLNGWKQTFAEDFTTPAATGGFMTAYGSRFVTYNPGTMDTSGNAMYDAARVLSVSDGALKAHFHTHENTARGAVLIPGGWSAQTYGRYSVRFKADPGLAGYGAAFLLWPGDNDWNKGEVDYPEGGLDGEMHGYNHCIGNPASNCYIVSTGKRFDSGWSTATIDWKPGSLTFYLDGQQVGHTTSSVPSTPMRWTLQAASHGSKPPAAVSGNLLIDWIVKYEYSPATVAPGPAPVGKKGDLSADGRVDITDLSMLLSGWGRAGIGDLNGDRTVSITDLSILLSNWG